MKTIADALMISVLEIDGRIMQIVETRIDEQARKIYWRGIELYEAAPYMFMPVPR